MRRFLITGLPRSRTRWLSVAASMPPWSVCIHEPTKDFQSFDELKAEWMQPRPFDFGFSDHALGFQLPRIMEEVGPHILIVERPFSQTLQSLEKYMAGIPINVEVAISFLTRLSERLAAAKGETIRRIAYKDLNDAEAVIDCLQWLVPDGEFDHVHDMMNSNIQVDRVELMQQIRKPHNQWYLA